MYGEESVERWEREFKILYGVRPKKPLPGARIFKRLWSPGIESKEWIPPACSLAGRYNNPIPTQFLAPTDAV